MDISRINISPYPRIHQHAHRLAILLNRKLHSFLKPPSPMQPGHQASGLFGHPYSPLPEDTPDKRKYHASAPRSSLKTMQPSYMTHDGSASWNSTVNPLSLTLPSQHRPLILHCACDLPLHTTPQTALTTQHRLNAQKSTRSSPPVSLSVRRALFNMFLATADPRPGDKR